MYLVDSEGVVIEHDGIGSFSNLPIIVGEGAEKEVSHFLKHLNKFIKIKKQLIFAIRVSKRRWNIKISKGITVKLPEQNVLQALNVLDKISDSNGLFNDDIASIDLRIPDRIIISKKKQSTEKNME